MSYNGSGTFVINSAGTPYVSGTVISSNAANSLNSDLATGLSTAICKDGQSTPTANIGLGGFKITNLGAGTVASDAARLSQVQNSGTTTLISITGTDTLTGVVTPTLSAYVAGQAFSFLVASTNTGAVTLNINSLGATAVTRTGAVALVAGDMVTGQVAIVEYDGTRFQLLNGNSFTNLKASGTLGVTGITTVAAGSAAAPSIVSTTGTADTGQFFPAADTIAYSTAGTERVRITSGGNVGIGTNAPTSSLVVSGAAEGTPSVAGVHLGVQGGYATIELAGTAATGSLIDFTQTGTESKGRIFYDNTSNFFTFGTNASERMRIESGGKVGIGTPSPGGQLGVTGGGSGPTAYFTQTTAGSYTAILDSVINGSTYYLMSFSAAATQTGSISSNGTTTTYATTSDYRLKENVKPMQNALDTVQRLNPVTYNWKSNGTDGQGFIAHELQAVVPDCVVGQKDATREEEYEISPAVPATCDADGNETTPAVEAVKGIRTIPSHQGIDTSFLVATLTAAIQELKAIIDTQAARITALETA